MTIAIAQPFIGEEEQEAVRAVLESGRLIQGQNVAEFEQAFGAFHQVGHAVAVSSGTAALTAALLAHGIGPGDEVIVPAFSFFATASAVLSVGAVAVFADIEPRTFTLSVAAARRAITPRTKALLPVHLYGQPADLPAFAALAREHSLILIEDAAQAHGAAIGSRRVGSSGTAAFSFHPSKNMTTTEGGMVTTDDAEVARKLRLIRNQGSERKYLHELVGANYRMTEVAAAIGLVQLRRLPAWNEARRRNAAFYDAALRGVVTPYVAPGRHHVYQQYTVRAEGEAARDRAVSRLAERGIEARVYYPLPLHRQPALLARGYPESASFPEAEAACRVVFSLPVHPHLGEEALDAVVTAVNSPD